MLEISLDRTWLKQNVMEANPPQAIDQSELDLILAAKADPQEFTKLYDKYLNQVYRYFYVRTSHKETAEDLTAQTFFQAFAAFERFEPRGLPFGAWLFRIAHNLLVNSYRKPDTFALELAENIATGEDVMDTADKNLSLQKVQGFIEELPERDREIVLLRSSADLSFAQIAEIVDVSEGAARTAYHRAVAKLINLATV